MARFPIMVALLLLLVSGCSTKDGEILAQVVQRTGKKLEAAAGGTPNQFAGRLRSTANPTIGLAERVETRLRWDRFLEGTKIEVELKEEGVVKLKGTAVELSKKQRALDLARATLGVKDVVDELASPKEE